MSSTQLHIPSFWNPLSQNIIKDIEDNQIITKPVILICGAKNTGKSTLGRFLINQLLAKFPTGVCYLEADVGQPEFTPSSLLSLHFIEQIIEGEPVDHLRETKHQFFFGSTTPQKEPDYYLDCLFNLFDIFTNNYSPSQHFLPLIINTQGWITGLGLELLERIVAYMKPHHIIQINRNTNYDANLNHILPFNHILPLSFVHSINPASFTMPKQSTEIRDLLLLKYFKFDRIPLSMQTTYSVPWNKLRMKIINHNVPPSMTLLSLNGNLVGLCADTSSSNGNIIKYPENIDTSLYPIFLKQTPLCNCVGLGIIRGIDPDRGIIYIITPVHKSLLSSINTLLKGDLEIPTEILLQSGLTSVPYIVTNALKKEGCGSAPMDNTRTNLLRSAK